METYTIGEADFLAELSNYNDYVHYARCVSARLNEAASYEMDEDKRERYLSLWKWVQDTTSSDYNLVRSVLNDKWNEMRKGVK